MKIRYNIADKKQINYFKLTLITSVLVVISLGFIVMGVYQFASTTKHFQEEKDELKAYKDKIDAINEKEVEHRQEMKKIKKKWGKKRNYLNGLIASKLYPHLEKLNKLEEVLPGGVFIEKIILGIQKENLFQLSIAAVSGQKLLEAYKVFLPFNMVVKSESETRGVYKAAISIQIQ